MVHGTYNDLFEFILHWAKGGLLEIVLKWRRGTKESSVTEQRMSGKSYMVLNNLYLLLINNVS